MERKKGEEVELHHVNNNPLHGDISSPGYHPSVPLDESLVEIPDTSLFDIIRDVQPQAGEFDVNRFFSLMGVLPMDSLFLLFKPPISKNFLFTKEHGWVLFLYIWLLLPILYFAWLVGTYKGWLNILSSLCMLLQPIITFRIVQLGWRVFRSKVSLPKKDVLDALQYSVRAGWGIFRLLFASHLTNVVWFSVCGVIQKVNAVSVIKSQIFSICGYGGSITFLSGASAMLIFQQRCSFKNMKKLQALVEDQTACLADFKTAKKSIKSREEITPINFILVSAAFNTIVSAIMILASDAGSMIELSEVVVFSIGIIGRQVIVLLWILWECTCINEIPDQIADEMVLTEWKGESERNRISLHTAFRHSSIGSEIFFYRPNRNEILLQMLATAGSVVFSVCYKLLLSVQGQQ